MKTRSAGRADKNAALTSIKGASRITQCLLRHAIFVLFVSLLFACAPVSALAAEEAGATLNALIAGSGPDLSHNQVAIESNVRYVSRLLPKNSKTRVLFADGSPQTKDVLYLDKDGKKQFRAPLIPIIDAPNRLPEFDSQLRALTKDQTENSSAPLLLYFTGHGSPGRENYENNQYDMWDGDELTVKHLARVLKTLPPTMPVTVVMVQCFSGSFGNLLFQNADPNGPLTNRTLCGFFACVASREAAGCTPEINEADYHDFTGYFFAALSGTDRLGKPLSGVDYNHDGRVGMNEAFAYTLLHDNSIDTPVCTSDVFLRRFLQTPNSTVTRTPFSQILSWAAPAQLVALNGLSDQLKLSGENRLGNAFQQFQKIRMDSEQLSDVRLIRFVRLARSVVLTHMLEASSDGALKARFAALLAAEAGNPLRPALFTTKRSLPSDPAGAGPANAA